MTHNFERFKISNTLVQWIYPANFWTTSSTNFNDYFQHFFRWKKRIHKLLKLIKKHSVIFFCLDVCVFRPLYSITIMTQVIIKQNELFKITCLHENSWSWLLSFQFWSGTTTYHSGYWAHGRWVAVKNTHGLIASDCLGSTQSFCFYWQT